MFSIIDEVWRKGDTIEPGPHGDMWTAGIHVVKANGREHGNAIEFYGKTKEEAEARRDYLLFASAYLEDQSKSYDKEGKVKINHFLE